MKWNEAERKNETSNAEIDHRNANNTINIILSCSVGANSSVEAKLVFGGWLSWSAHDNARKKRKTKEVE